MVIVTILTHHGVTTLIFSLEIQQFIFYRKVTKLNVKKPIITPSCRTR